MTNVAMLPSEGSDTRSSNVALPVSQWHWIDQQHTNVFATWRTAKKNVIIRAALTIAMESNPDLNGCTSEDDITDRLRQAIIQQGSAVQASDLERRVRLLEAAVNAVINADLADTVVIDEMIEWLSQTHQ